MAVYKVVQERVLLPYQYLENTGEEASHDTDAKTLAVNERGNPETAVATLERRTGRLIYQTKTDFGKLDEDEQASAFYAHDKYSVNRLEKKGAIEKVDL